MNPKPSQYVYVVYAGPLQTKGRLFRQLQSLTSAGVKCELIVGSPQPERDQAVDAGCPTHVIPIKQTSGPLQSFITLKRFCDQAGDIVAKSGADTVLCLGLGCWRAGAKAKRIRPEIRLILDCNEMNIEAIDQRLKKWIWAAIERKCLSAANIVFHAESNRMRIYSERYPQLKGKRQILVENFPPFAPQNLQKPRPGDQIRVVYLGGFGAGRFTDEIIKTFSEISSDYKLDIVGYGCPDYVERIKADLLNRNVSNVRILPAIPHAEILDFLSDYDIGLAFYRNTNLNNYYCAPNKVYDYLMAGLPVITNDYPGLIDVVERNSVGACVSSVDNVHIEAAILRIVNDRLVENITPELQSRYSWEYQLPNYLEAYGIDATEGRLQ